MPMPLFVADGQRRHLQTTLYVIVALSCTGSYWTLKALGLSFVSWDGASDVTCAKLLHPWLMLSLGHIAASSLASAFCAPDRLPFLKSIVTYYTFFNVCFALFWSCVIFISRNCFTCSSAYAVHISWTLLLCALCTIALS